MKIEEIMARAICATTEGDDTNAGIYYFQAKSALSALKEAGFVVAQGWMPIETAKTGLNCYNGAAAERVLVLTKYGPFTAHNEGEEWIIHALTPAAQQAEPTHWMPLQPRPMIAAQEEDDENAG